MIERLNRSIKECAESMRHDSGLDNSFWAFSVCTAVHLLNRRPHSKFKDKTTPFEHWHGSKPDLSYLRSFGSCAYVHIPSQTHRKLDPRSIRCIFIGYPSDLKGYEFWDPVHQKIVTSRFQDARFDELSSRNEMFEQPSDDITCWEDSHSDYDFVPSSDARISSDTASEGHEATTSNEHIVASERHHGDASCPQEHSNHDRHDQLFEDRQLLSNTDLQNRNEIVQVGEIITEPPPSRPSTPSNERRYPTRNRKQPSEWWKAPSCNMTTPRRACDIPTPLTPEQALSESSPFRLDWKKAMDAELDNLRNTNTWTICDLPEDRKAIDSKWVFKVKAKEDGSVDKFKARLVIKGFSQRPGIDFDETFSPVAHAVSVRMVFALAAASSMHLRQIDIVGAFLQADLTEEIYMKQPFGFQNVNPNKVCRLNKSLYGLKQAGLEWNKTINEYLTASLGMRRLHCDPCPYLNSQESPRMILALSTDDILIASDSQDAIEEFVTSISNRFPVTDLGQPRKILGMRVKRDKNGISIDQQGYVQELLERFNMIDCETCDTPAQPGLYLTPTGETLKTDKRKFPYRELVGGLNWLATSTRPDIAATVSTLCQYLDNPDKEHWTAAKRVLRYLKSTSNYGLHYRKSDLGVTVTGYSDSDCVEDQTKVPASQDHVQVSHTGPVVVPALITGRTGPQVVPAHDYGRTGPCVAQPPRARPPAEQPASEASFL